MSGKIRRDWWCCGGDMRGYSSAEIVVGYVERGEIVVVMGKNKVGLG